MMACIKNEGTTSKAGFPMPPGGLQLQQQQQENLIQQQQLLLQQQAQLLQLQAMYSAQRAFGPNPTAEDFDAAANGPPIRSAYGIWVLLRRRIPRL